MPSAPPRLRQKLRAKYISPLDEVELAVRLIEAGSGAKRPVVSARETLAGTDADIVEIALFQARAAIAYFAECINAANATN